MAPSSLTSRNYGNRQVANLGLPTNIPCNSCKKIKTTSACFSSNQQSALRQHMRSTRGFNASKDSFAVCSSCTSGQVKELTCYWCDKTKGLDKFPDTQRSKPDTAECWNCQQERLGMEPAGKSSDDDDSGGSYSDGAGSGSGEDYNMPSSPGGAALPADMDNLSIHNGATYTSYNSAGSSVGGGVGLGSGSTGTFVSAPSGASTGGWTMQSSRRPNAPTSTTARSSASVTSVPASSASTITNVGKGSFNPNMYGKPGRCAPGSEAGSTSSTPAKSDARKFAKVKAVKREIKYDVAEEERKQEEEDKKEKKSKSANPAVEDVEYDWGKGGQSSDDE